MHGAGDRARRPEKLNLQNRLPRLGFRRNIGKREVISKGIFGGNVERRAGVIYLLITTFGNPSDYGDEYPLRVLTTA